jgi:cyclopropane-fatty-acyl-phospholipid synthase
MNSDDLSFNPGASAQAIQHHYDLSNDFYCLWLDRELNYSAAMWKPGDTLDSAQARKVDYHIAQACAAGAERVLDVGCGWGAVLRRLVEDKEVRRAVGLTLSKAQAERISSLAIPQIEVRLENWTEHTPTGPYDAIISIGAFEHFSRLESSDRERIDGYRRFFERCHDWLKPAGRMSLQTFAYGGARPRSQSMGTQFLAREIFQETDPPTLSEIAIAAQGIFEVMALRNDRMDYGRTCRHWLRRLRENRERAVAVVGDENVSRYERYLQLSTIGFETGRLSLFRITLAALT